METSKLRVFTAFSGYDLQCLALNRLPIDYELVGWSEIDKYAIKAHNCLFPSAADKNFGDISKIDWSQVSDFDLFTYSSPCQDFSQAGLQRGGEQGSGTRSSLLWECERAIAYKRPRYLLMENVSALVSAKFIRLFHKWLLTLEGYGYKSFSKVLNAKDFGIPQNRERIFVVSIKVDDKSAWESTQYHFPKEIPLEKVLLDVLENEVDESYFLSDERIKGLINSTTKEKSRGCGFAFKPKSKDDIANTLQTNPIGRKTDNFILINDQDGLCRTIKAQYGKNGAANFLRQSGFGATGVGVLGWTRDEKGNVVDYHQVDVANCVTSAKRSNTQNDVVCRPDDKEINVVGNIYGGNAQAGRVYAEDGISPSIDTCQGGNREPKILINTDIEGDTRTINTHYQEMNLDSVLGKPRDGYGYVRTAAIDGYRIRKLTERECFRLMGLAENEIDILMSSGISKTRLYQLAGNSIVVNVLEAIFRKIFLDTAPDDGQLKLF